MQATLSLLFGCRAFCLLNELVSIMLAFFPGGFLTKVCQLLQKSLGVLLCARSFAIRRSSDRGQLDHSGHVAGTPAILRSQVDSFLLVNTISPEHRARPLIPAGAFPLA